MTGEGLPKWMFYNLDTHSKLYFPLQCPKSQEELNPFSHFFWKA